MNKLDGFENYEITRDGKVFSKNSNKFLKPSDNRFGYLGVTLYKNKKRHYFYIHRLVALTFIKNPNNKLYVNHKDGIKSNNNVKNLEWCSALENMQHASKNNLTACGNKQHLAKLSLNKANEIRKLYATGKYSQRELAKKFGITQRPIAMVINNITWRNRK